MSQKKKISPEDLEDVQRSIYFEKYIWDALNEEAKLCGRTPLKQFRQILLNYYDLPGYAEIDKEKLKQARRKVTGVIHQDNDQDQKKAG